MPSDKSYLGFVINERSSNMGPMGLGSHSYNCKRITRLEPELVAESIDLLKTVRILARYLRMSEKDIALTDFLEFFKNPDLYDWKYRKEKPAESAATKK